MSPSYTSPRWRDVARAGAPLALAIALTATASAQAATWSDDTSAIALKRSGAQCSRVVPVPRAATVSLQSCVNVSGNVVRGAAVVTNNRTARRPAILSAATRITMDNRHLPIDDCGLTTLASGQTKICYGVTTIVPGRHDVFSTGYVRTAAGAHAAVKSPTRKTGRGVPAAPVRAAGPALPAKPALPVSPAPPPAPAGFPAAWSNGPVNAPTWHPRLVFHPSITCGDRSIPAGLPPQSRQQGWTARTRSIAKTLRGPSFGWTKLYGAANGTTTGHIDESFHYCGRAIDAFAPRAVSGVAVTGSALRNSWRLANWAAHNAAALKVSQVIFYDRIWSALNGGWRPYRHISGSDDPTLQHRDHVHISVY